MVCKRAPTAHNVRGKGGAPLCRLALSFGRLSPKAHYVVCRLVDTSNMLHAFAFSSAASSVRKPPESERCTTCRQVVDTLRRHAYADGTVPSQGIPLAIDQRVERSTCGATVADCVCNLG